MSTNQNQNPEQEHKKNVRNFTIMIICSGLAGMLIAIISFVFDREFIREKLPDILASGIQTALPILMAITCVLLPCISLGLFYSCKNRYREDMPTEELDRLEYDLNIPLILSSVAMILSFTCMGCMMVYLEETPDLLSLLCCVMFIFHFVLIFIVQKNTVEFIKILNPEKKGDVFDKNFADVWEASCDEAEQLMIYKASHKAYRTATKTCTALWIFCSMCPLFFDTGVFPIFVVGIIWLSLHVSYMRTALKQERAMIQAKSDTPTP